MTFLIIKREDSDYSPLLMCEKCKEHTRHAKGDSAAWRLTDTKVGELISTKFQRVNVTTGVLSVTYRTAWECGECGTERVWGV